MTKNPRKSFPGGYLEIVASLFLISRCFEVLGQFKCKKELPPNQISENLRNNTGEIIVF